MVKNEINRDSYSEEYDYPALKELGDMAKINVANDNGIYELHGKRCPDGTFSDFSLCVYDYMGELIRFGMKLQRKIDGKEVELNG